MKTTINTLLATIVTTLTACASPVLLVETTITEHHANGGKDVLAVPRITVESSKQATIQVGKLGALPGGGPPPMGTATSLTHPSRDPNDVLRQIELNVALKQYEKVLMELADTELKIDLGPEEGGLSEQQTAEWRIEQGQKVKILDHRSQQFRAKIELLIAEANKAAQAAAVPVGDSPIQSSPTANDSSPEALAAAAQRGVSTAKADIEAGKMRIIEYGEVARLITLDPETKGLRTQSLRGHPFTAQAKAEADAYNKVMRESHARTFTK